MHYNQNNGVSVCTQHAFMAKLGQLQHNEIILQLQICLLNPTKLEVGGSQMAGILQGLQDGIKEVAQDRLLSTLPPVRQMQPSITQ